MFHDFTDDRKKQIIKKREEKNSRPRRLHGTKNCVESFTIFIIFLNLKNQKKKNKSNIKLRSWPRKKKHEEKPWR